MIMKAKRQGNKRMEVEEQLTFDRFVDLSSSTYKNLCLPSCTEDLYIVNWNIQNLRGRFDKGQSNEKEISPNIPVRTKNKLNDFADDIAKLKYQNAWVSCISN